MPNFNNTRNARPGYRGSRWKYKHYVHSPFQLEHQGITAKVDDHGKITIEQNHPDGTYDEIICSASFVYKLNNMLLASMKVVFKDEPYKPEGEGSSTEEQVKNG